MIWNIEWKETFACHHYISSSPNIRYGVLLSTAEQERVGIVLFQYYMPEMQSTVHVSRWVILPKFQKEKLGVKLLVLACRSVFLHTRHRVLIRLQNFELADALLRTVFFTKLPTSKLFSVISETSGLKPRSTIDKPSVTLVFSESVQSKASVVGGETSSVVGAPVGEFKIREKTNRTVDQAPSVDQPESISAASRRLGLTRVYLQNLKSQGRIRWVNQLVEIVRLPSDDRREDFRDEQTAKMREQVKKLRIENAQAAGQLVVAAEVERQLWTLLTVFRENALGIPRRMGARLVGLPENEIEDALYEEVNNLLQTLGEEAKRALQKGT